MWSTAFPLFLLLRLAESKTFTMEIRQTMPPEQWKKVSPIDKTGPLPFDKNQLYKYNPDFKGVPQPFVNLQNVMYLSNITLGSPPQTFTVVMDTGSTVTWVVDSDCVTTWCNGIERTRNKFDYNASSTFNETTLKFADQYGKGYVEGIYANDTLSFGAFTIDQMFGLVHEMDQEMGEQPHDGIFGMAWTSLGNGETPPIFQILDQLDEPIFTVFMGLTTDPSAGRITYGGLDTEYCDDEVFYTNLTNLAHWEVQLTGFSIGNWSFDAYDEMFAFSDTGTSVIVAPWIVTLNILRITSAGMYFVPCENVSTLPSFVFTFNETDFDIPPEQYIFKLSPTAKKCYLLLIDSSSVGLADNYWILGNPFIRSWCQTYDIGQERLGFAKANPRKGSSHLQFGQAILFVMLVFISL